MERNDVLPFARMPHDIEKFLVKVGGKNPFGEPVFRLSVAEGLMKQAGAEFYKWPEGLILHQHGGNFVDDDGRIMQEPAARPLSIDAEVRWIRKYPSLKGWVLEEWHPAAKFGTQEEWEGRTVPGHPSVPVLGPYNPLGRYVLALPYGYGQPARGHENEAKFQGRPGLPPNSVLKTAIEWIEYNRNFWGRLTPPERRALWDNEDLAREALRRKFERDNAEDRAKDVANIILSTSLEAARIREGWARSAGIKGHVGA